VHPLVLAPLGHLTHQPLDAVRGVRYPHPLHGNLGEGDHEPCVPLQELRGLRVASTPELAGHLAELSQRLVYPGSEPLPILRMPASRVDEGEDDVPHRFARAPEIDSARMI